jgi:hypothetical protein
MVLADLGSRLGGALNQLSRASVVDDKVGPFVCTLIVTNIRSLMLSSKSSLQRY